MRLLKKLGLSIITLSLFGDIFSFLLFSLSQTEERKIKKTTDQEKQELKKAIADLEKRLDQLEQAAEKKPDL